jgi:exonuclease III
MNQKLNIEIACWNVNGLMKREGNKSICKLSKSGFSETIKQFDIVCLLETKVGPDVNLIFDRNFVETAVYRNKKKSATMFSGGLVLYVRSTLREGITFIPPTSSEYMWIKLKKDFFNTAEDIFVCFAYINPENSTYTSDIDVLHQIQLDIANFKNTGKCILMGDLNGHTQTQNDFSSLDNDSDSNYIPLPLNYNADTSMARKIHDTRPPDNRGKEILELCKASNMKIINGRKFGDTNGRFTCYSRNALIPSVIDYTIVDSDIFQEVTYFKVDSLTTYSDHCPIFFRLKANFVINRNQEANVLNLKPLPSKYIWTDKSADAFIHSLNNTDIKKDISNICDTRYNMDTQGIKNVVNNLNTVMYKAAEMANIASKTPHKKRKKQKNRKIFDSSWYSAKKELRLLARQVEKKPFDRNLIQKFYSTKKKRNKILKANTYKVRDNLIQQLNNLHENNPKAYWGIVDDLEKLHSDKDQPDENIDPKIWLEHFRKLMYRENTQLTPQQKEIETSIENHPNLKTFSNLDFHINSQEISKAILLLKTGKSAGEDRILNDMLKAGRDVLLPVIQKTFNLIYTSGIFPEAWAVSIIKPLFKGGNPFDTSDYRGISLSSCIGKLFCSVLNTRLVQYLEDNNIYIPNQIAFRKKFRTNDHIFTLQTLINKYTCKQGSKTARYLYVCFVDLRKAFDTVWRAGLFHKLLENGIGGKLYSMVKDMYSKSKACVKLPSGLTEYFDTNVGVKQGCVISPTLFNLFLNDIPEIFDYDRSDPVVLYEMVLNCLMFADDIALVSSSAKGLQHCLDKLNIYCKKWGLQVNSKKTKVIIFNRAGCMLKNNSFRIDNEEIEIVKETKYLGIIFNNNCTFHSTAENLKNKSLKAMFKLFKSFGNMTPKINTSLHLFDAMVKPILLYNAEIWGPTLCNLDKLLEIDTNKTQLYYKFPFEKLHTKWAKYILGINSKSTNIAVTAELGRFPLVLEIIVNAVKYWFRMKNAKQNTILYDCYLANIEMARNGSECWLGTIEKIANLSNFHDQVDNEKTALKKVSNFLKNRFTKQFEKDIFNDERSNDGGNKLRTFRKFKINIKLEPYLSEITDVNTRRNLTKLRISAHNLHIETGRHVRPRKTPLNERTCSHCLNKIESEFHVIIECDKFRETRSVMLNNIYEKCTGYIDMGREELFVHIMSMQDTVIIQEMEKFVRSVSKIRGNL